MTRKSDQAFRTISEVAEFLDLPQHVLRFWETKFRQVSPLKRGGGRRYYRPQDVELLGRIKSLLHTEGYTIKGVQRMLGQGGVKNLPPLSPTTASESNVVVAGDEVVGDVVEGAPVSQSATHATPVLDLKPNKLSEILGELEEIRDLLSGTIANPQVAQKNLF